MRALKIELRRSAALWAGFLTLLIAFGVFYGLPGPWHKGPDAWTEGWTSLAIWQRWLLNMLWPLALGAGAWQGRRDRRAEVDELMVTMPKTAVQRAVPPVAALCLSMVGAYLVIFLVGAAQVLGNASYFHADWLPVTIVGMLSLVAAVLIGMGIGHALPYLLTAPILAVLAFAATTLALVGGPSSGSVIEGTVSHQFALMTPVINNPNNPFLAVADGVTAVQGLWFLGLAVTGFGLLTFAGRRAQVLALVPAVAAGVLTYFLLPSRDGVFKQDETASALVCADSGPRVCVSRLHQDKLGEYVGPAQEALTKLAKLPGGPTSAVEARTGPFKTDSLPPSGDTAYFVISDFGFTKHVKQTILAGPERVRCDNGITGYDRSEAKRAVVASWLNGEPKPVSPRELTEGATEIAGKLWDEVRAMPADQQPARIAALRAEARDC
ncbi:ABC transporter permease [Kibdelosporangium phytohabitans]|uniref:Uncharacterized protein n=1 Tax=Kibdelosporangium phytohabitans TaxID=860235 RepID=A0A0N9I8P6_9PSEU|nr:ABC transporter permease [Kibdelosporangium phytohabitans]ALG12297.1 hypothetical protein AOZ06_40430 [Kibdelosporangium phytohabitans]MBE1463854.1 hypothetical protein [Kibdelosporangium phytohabitans]